MRRRRPAKTTMDEETRMEERSAPTAAGDDRHSVPAGGSESGAPRFHEPIRGGKHRIVRVFSPMPIEGASGPAGGPIAIV
jgi:hypothetical protein